MFVFKLPDVQELVMGIMFLIVLLRLSSLPAISNVSVTSSPVSLSATFDAYLS